MLEQHIRPWCQKLFIDKTASLLAPFCSPNFITLLALLFGILVPLWLYLSHPYLAICFLLISGYCDMLDGSIARQQSNSTQLGTISDIVADRVVEYSVVLGLFFLDPATHGLGCILMLGSMLFCITSFLLAGIFTENKSTKQFHYSPGLMERAEAFIFFIAMILLPKHFLALSILFFILVTWTGVNRIYKFKDLS